MTNPTTWRTALWGAILAYREVGEIGFSGAQKAINDLLDAAPAAQPDTGDTIKHLPTDEEWLVAFVENGKLCACGWPCSLVPVEDCVLVKKASPQHRINLLNVMAAMTGDDVRKRYAVRALAATPPQALQHPAEGAEGSAETQQATAWFAVIAALNVASPEWMKPNLSALDCAVKAIRELAAAPTSEKDARDAWRDIESAPKSGLVDILSSGRRYADCYYDRICDEYRHITACGVLIRLDKSTHWMLPPAVLVCAVVENSHGEPRQMNPTK